MTQPSEWGLPKRRLPYHASIESFSSPPHALGSIESALGSIELGPSGRGVGVLARHASGTLTGAAVIIITCCWPDVAISDPLMESEHGVATRNFNSTWLPSGSLGVQAWWAARLGLKSCDVVETGRSPFIKAAITGNRQPETPFHGINPRHSMEPRFSLTRSHPPTPPETHRPSSTHALPLGRRTRGKKVNPQQDQQEGFRGGSFVRTPPAGRKQERNHGRALLQDG